jgi:phosphoribosylglycinamide formyltransferase-1
MKSIVILASGRGSNAARIIDYFDDLPTIQVKALISDRKESGALQMASSKGVPGHYFPINDIKSGALNNFLKELKPDLIVLAGFLRMIPQEIILAFPEAIINVHPSLLPRHGGRGMYGNHVHAAVLAAQEKESGITIHYVNEEYDKGRIIAQFHCPVHSDDTSEQLAARVLALEHRYLSVVIHAILSL